MENEEKKKKIREREKQQSIENEKEIKETHNTLLERQFIEFTDLFCCVVLCIA